MRGGNCLFLRIGFVLITLCLENGVWVLLFEVGRLYCMYMEENDYRWFDWLVLSM